MKDGQPLDGLTGPQSDDQINEFLAKHLPKKEELLQKIPGYLSKEHFEKVLAFFNTEAYNSINWEEFEKNFKSKINP